MQRIVHALLRHPTGLAGLHRASVVGECMIKRAWARAFPKIHQRLSMDLYSTLIALNSNRLIDLAPTEIVKAIRFLIQNDALSDFLLPRKGPISIRTAMSADVFEIVARELEPKSGASNAECLAIFTALSWLAASIPSSKLMIIVPVPKEHSSFTLADLVIVDTLLERHPSGNSAIMYIKERRREHPKCLVLMYLHVIACRQFLLEEGVVAPPRPALCDVYIAIALDNLQENIRSILRSLSSHQWLEMLQICGQVVCQLDLRTDSDDTIDLLVDAIDGPEGDTTPEHQQYVIIALLSRWANRPDRIAIEFQESLRIFIPAVVESLVEDGEVCETRVIVSLFLQLYERAKIDLPEQRRVQVLDALIRLQVMAAFKDNSDDTARAEPLHSDITLGAYMRVVRREQLETYAGGLLFQVAGDRSRERWIASQLPSSKTEDSSVIFAFFIVSLLEDIPEDNVYVVRDSCRRLFRLYPSLMKEPYLWDNLFQWSQQEDSRQIHLNKPKYIFFDVGIRHMRKHKIPIDATLRSKIKSSSCSRLLLGKSYL